MPVSYQCFKGSLTALERLQQFKVPFFKFYEEFLFSFGEMDKSDESMCEFFLISDNAEVTAYLETVENVDEEIEITAIKLAKLLALKETELKNNLKLWNKQKL